MKFIGLKKQFLTVLATGLVVPFLPLKAVQAASCVPMINDANAWIKASTGSRRNYLGFTMTAAKGQAKFVGYTSGAFWAALPGGGVSASSAVSVFSDRAWCPELSPGSLCTNYQGFDYRKSDKVDVSLLPTGTGVARVVLKSWGGATYDVPLSCSQEFLYGVLKEPNGESFITISLRKGTQDVPR
jgi:hypothetical protein